MLCDSCLPYCYYIKKMLVQFRRCWRSSPIFKENMHLFETEAVIYFCEVFQCYAFPQCHNSWMNKLFLGRLCPYAWKVVLWLWGALVASHGPFGWHVVFWGFIGFSLSWSMSRVFCFRFECLQTIMLSFGPFEGVF